MAPRSVEILSNAALRLRELEVEARTHGHDDVARASGILATRYETAVERAATSRSARKTRTRVGGAGGILTSERNEALIELTDSH